ncbi:MAG: hypothetical protein QNJ84_16055 [Alphaproteobacteria bacterium]|nr:hypothetical protein [Alphaproteobacteria bacterium]
MIRVSAFPRVHVTLIDLAGVTGRKFGGAGFAVDALPTVVRAEGARTNALDGFDRLDARGRADVDALLMRLLGRTDQGGVRLTLEAAPPQHVGLGSKTSLLLAIAVACDRIGTLGLEPEAMRSISGRGGASGVGSHSFFEGGFIIDGGHPWREGESFAPSSAGPPRESPPLLVRARFPAHWRILLLLPEAAAPSVSDEAAFFARNAPIAPDAVFDVLAGVYHGVAPAVAAADLPALKKALAKIQHRGFKQAELAAQPVLVRSLLSELQAQDGVAAGLSSLGPLIYAIYAAEDGLARDWVLKRAAEHASVCVADASARNRGFETDQING